MERTGKFAGISKNLSTGETVISFVINGQLDESIDEIVKCEKLTITAKPYRKKRSLDANAFLWACLGDIAAHMHPPADKWDIYLLMLKRYGKYTYIVLKPEAVERMRSMWRETEIVGYISVNGEPGVQLLCYYGSSTYNSKEMSVLLDGVVSEMKEMGLAPPPAEEMRQAIRDMERRERAKANKSAAVRQENRRKDTGT